MSFSKARFDSVQSVVHQAPRPFRLPTDENGKPLRVSEYFGQNTFDLRRMREKLPKDIYKKIVSTIETGARLDAEVANVVANAVKDWCLENGVSHYCHWFQPQTGGTAEKHDAFIHFDREHGIIERFSGGELIQSEPDASSFPSGGIRSTFEARGYTAWDPSSPMFIVESTNTKTLCIPSAFISYYGHALDHKTGLLRSNEALSKKACELLEVLGQKVDRVVSTIGCEQEYFLVDRAFFASRPDLLMTGRTLLGAQPSKGQQLNDHYFGSIPTRVQAFMGELEYECYRLGVPIKTRHNEVAPHQYECAPIFEESNVAVDHNHLVMEYLKKIAKRHSFEVLLHEKPFAELNGSGKHTNWSMSIMEDGDNLVEPGATPYQNLRFLVCLMGILKGVKKHAGLLRAGIATSGNDHRLGDHEAPPAIISVFLGETLDRILDLIEEEGTAQEEANHEETLIKIGVKQLPQVKKDNTDRNRTSPFAFTGNKFEFRAVGSSAPTARAASFLNAAIADGLSEMTAALRVKLEGATSRESAILSVIRDAVVETKAIRFEGNNYTEDWVQEAKKRGLPNLRKTPEALKEMLSEKSRKLLTSLEVYSEEEIQSRYNTCVERYVNGILIEANCLKNLIDSQIVPACFSYHRELAVSVAAAQTAGVDAPQKKTLNSVGRLLTDLQKRREALSLSIAQVMKLSENVEQADELANQVIPAMEALRTVADELELVVADHYWPFPKYREMLYLG